MYDLSFLIQHNCKFFFLTSIVNVVHDRKHDILNVYIRVHVTVTKKGVSATAALLR